MEVAVKQFQITQKTAWVVASNTQKKHWKKEYKKLIIKQNRELDQEFI